MLTDASLKHLKPKKNPYKVADRDGIYVQDANHLDAQRHVGWSVRAV